LSHLLQSHAHELLGHEETQQLLTRLGKSAPKLIEDLVPKILPMSVVVKVFQLLLLERVPIRNMRTICETLAERHPEAKLLPADPMTRAMVRSYCAEMHSGFPDVRDQLSMDFVRRHPLPALRDATKAQLARILTAWELALEHHGSHGGYLFGHFSLADCMYAPVVSRFVTFGVEVSAPVKSYMERIIALPAMQDWAKASQAEVDAGLA